MNANSLHRKKTKHPGFFNRIDNLFIDGISLCKLLTTNSLGFNPKYLVPTISCEIRGGWDREYIWSLLNNKNSDNHFPILMCSEGDLSCLEHLVFVHIEYESNFILWKKFGIISNAKNYEKQIGDLLVCSKTVDSIKYEEIDWFEEGKVYKFEKKKYEDLMNYYRITNEERNVVEEITDWFLGFSESKIKKYIYLLVDSKNQIKLRGSNKIIDNWSEWVQEMDYSFKKNSLVLTNEYVDLSTDKIIELIKKSIAETKKYAGENIMNCSSIIFIEDNKGRQISIKNKKVKQRKKWFNDWNPSRLISYLKDKID